MHQSEHSNTRFLILRDVALFATIPYAMTQSGRGSGTVDKGRAK